GALVCDPLAQPGHFRAQAAALGRGGVEHRAPQPHAAGGADGGHEGERGQSQWPRHVTADRHPGRAHRAAAREQLPSHGGRCANTGTRPRARRPDAGARTRAAAVATRRTPGTAGTGSVARRGRTCGRPRADVVLAGPARVKVHGSTGTWSRPVPSGSPNMRFIAWTPCPDAPSTRLSSTTSTISRSLPGGRCTAMRAVFEARTERVSGVEPAGMTSTKGSPA